MTNPKTQTKRKRGRPPLSAAKKMQRSKAAQAARMTHRALRAKIEHKKMEANYKALAVAKAKFSSKKSVKRTLMTKGRGKPAQPNIMKKGMRKRGRPRKMK